MCCHLTPSKVTAAVNGYSIHKFQVELAISWKKVQVLCVTLHF